VYTFGFGVTSPLWYTVGNNLQLWYTLVENPFSKERFGKCEHDFGPNPMSVLGRWSVPISNMLFEVQIAFARV
jgi:hypothetical protein